MEPRTRIRLCGPFRLEIDGREMAGELPGGQAGSLLFYLVANRSRAADRAALIDVVWPTRPPKDPQAHLRPILTRLRRVLGPGALEGRDQVRLTLPEPVWVDLEQTMRAVEDAREASKKGEWENAARHAAEALELVRPGFLPGHEGEWVQARRLELEELELEALEWRARSALETGELSVAEQAARELVARSPYRESGYRFQMQALAAQGNAAEGLRVYDRLRVLLRDELGVAPAAAIQAVHRRLLAGDARPEPAVKRVPLPARLSPRERGALVAREAELAALLRVWGTARAGERRFVLVSGEPGIGKTRLASELALAAHTDGTVLYAACQQESLLPYQPFVEALRHFARSRPAGVALGAGAADLAPLIPELAPSSPQALPGDAEARRYLMFEAVSDLLATASERFPLLLVLDDLHWADEPTLRLLKHVTRAQQPASLMIVGAYREAEIGLPLTDLLADLRRDGLFERISLSGLDEDGVGALIAAHAGHQAPSSLVRSVHEHTEGNPFFVGEVLRNLIETGALFERDGRLTWTLTADEIGVPEGVKEVLVRRLARLSEDSRTALSHAAVLGREFSFDVLRAMSDAADDNALIAALEEALAAQLIVESRGDYAFTHALVRETLYGALSGPRRQRLHARAARALEPGGSPEELAVHLRCAGPVGDPAKALEYSLRAGQRARELFAWEDAAAHFDGAVTLMPRAAARAPLLVELGDLMVVVGDLTRQIEYLERALALYEELGDQERTAQVHSRLGMAHSLIDSIYAEHMDIGRAFGHYDAARGVLERGPLRKARGHLEVGIATALTYALRVDEGLEAGARAVEIAERLGDDVLWAAAAEAHAWHLIVAGELREGFAKLERCVEVIDREQRSMLAWMGLIMRGQMTWALGAPDEAQPFFERYLRLPYAGKTAYRQETADGLGRCHVSRGEMAQARRLLSDAKPTWITHSLGPLLDLWDGRWDKVDGLARRVLDTSRRTGNRWDEWASCHLAARVASLRGEHEHAGELLEQALAIVVDGGAPYFEMWVRPDLARVRAAGGRLEEARGHLERCRQIMAHGEDWRGRGGHVELAEAMVLALEQRPDEADRRFADAAETLRRHRLRVDEADALHQWGRALTRAGDAPRAAEKLDAALEIYDRHDADAKWLAPVNEARAKCAQSVPPATGR